MSTKKEISTFDMNEENQKNINIKTIIYIIKDNIRFFFTIFLFISIFVALISLFLPDIFRANAKILPPQQNQSATSAILSQLGGFAGGATSALGLKNSNDIFVGFLKSRTVADNLIKRFNLKEHYNLESLEKTRQKLETNSTISYGKDNIISIDIDDKNPTLAANLANAYVDELVALTNKFALTEASQRRIFFLKNN